MNSDTTQATSNLAIATSEVFVGREWALDRVDCFNHRRLLASIG
jgi:hypothetical protein